MHTTSSTSRKLRTNFFLERYGRDKMNEPHQKTFSDILSLILGSVITGSVLVAAHDVVPTEQSQNPSNSNTTEQLSPPSNSTDFSPNNVSVDVQQQLGSSQSFAEILNEYSNRFHRNLALYNLVNQMSEASLIRLVDEIDGFEMDAATQHWRTEALTVALLKLVHTNASQVGKIFLEVSEHSKIDIVYGIAREWAIIDLESAAKFVEQLLNEEVKMNAANGVLDAQQSLLSLDELESLAIRLGNGQYIADLIRQKQYIEEAKHPEKAWTALVQDPSQLVQENFLRLLNIAEAWVKQSGMKVIPIITESIKNQGLRQSLQYRILHTAALQDVEAAFEYAIHLPDIGYLNPISSVLSVWAEIDPLAAWERIKTIESAKVRKNLVEDLMNYWSTNDHQLLLESLDRFPRDVQDEARANLIDVVVDSSTADALAMYHEIKNKKSKAFAARLLVLKWATRDMESAFKWVLTEPSTDHERDYLIKLILPKMTQSDYQNAFQVARNQPVGVDGNEEIGLEATVIEGLVYSYLDEALQLLSQVRDGETKYAAFRTVGRALVRNDRLEEAIEKGNELTGEHQIRYYTSIGFVLNVREDPESAFVRLDKLPSEKAQSRIAVTWISNSHNSKIFSASQIERLIQYLTDDDRDLLKRVATGRAIVPPTYRGM